MGRPEHSRHSPRASSHFPVAPDHDQNKEPPQFRLSGLGARHKAHGIAREDVEEDLPRDGVARYTHKNVVQLRNVLPPSVGIELHRLIVNVELSDARGVFSQQIGSKHG